MTAAPDSDTNPPSAPASSVDPTTKDEPSPVALRLLEDLREDLRVLFDPDNRNGPDTSVYNADVFFEDPLNQFRGAKRYASNISFLKKSPVFSDSTLVIHDSWIRQNVTADELGIPGGDQERESIRTRWTLEMTANLPWKPRVVFTGTSDYVVDEETGKVSEHIDLWDSLTPEENKFFSMSAVRHLLDQAAPPRKRIGSVLEDMPYTTLRKAKSYELRTYRKFLVEPSNGAADLGADADRVLRRFASGSTDPAIRGLAMLSINAKGIFPVALGALQAQSNEKTVLVRELPDAVRSDADLKKAMADLLRTAIHKDNVAEERSETQAWLVRYPGSRVVYELWIETGAPIFRPRM